MKDTLLKIMQNLMVAKRDKDENLVSQVIAFMLSFSCRKGPIGQKEKTHNMGAIVFHCSFSSEMCLGVKGSIAVCHFLGGLS